MPYRDVDDVLRKMDLSPKELEKYKSLINDYRIRQVELSEEGAEHYESAKLRDNLLDDFFKENKSFCSKVFHSNIINDTKKLSAMEKSTIESTNSNKERLNNVAKKEKTIVERVDGTNNLLIQDTALKRAQINHMNGEY